MSRFVTPSFVFVLSSILLVQKSYAQRLANWQQNDKVEADKELFIAPITITHYFATWCKPCMEELPVFDSLSRLKPGLIAYEFISLDIANTHGLYKKIKKLHLPGNVYYLAPTTKNVQISTINWDGTLPFSVIHFPTEKKQLIGKQTLDTFLKLITSYEN